MALKLVSILVRANIGVKTKGFVIVVLFCTCSHLCELSTVFSVVAAIQDQDAVKDEFIVDDMRTITFDVLCLVLQLALLVLGLLQSTAMDDN